MHEIFKIGKAMETERLMVARGWGRVEKTVD